MKQMKATAIAPANIAFIKYWGVRDEKLRLPTNGSISMNLSNLLTTTTVEFDNNFKKDIVIIDGREVQSEKDRVSFQLDKIRSLAKIRLKAKVISKNTFPSSTGLSSSASGFAALTTAGAKACGLILSDKELSVLARLGSGSACRSIPDGFVEWLPGNTSESSYAVSLYPADYWDIVDVVGIVSKEKKEISSTEGHQLARTSPFFPNRLTRINESISLLKQYIKDKNFTAFGELTETEALELHAIYLTSHPSLIYLLPETLQVIQSVKKWRKSGLAVYFTLNTGQDIHLICQKKDSEKVQKLLSQIPQVKEIIPNKTSVGVRLTKKHLF